MPDAGMGPESPILRATSETGDAIDDPSEDALFMMLEDIEGGDGTFLIVDKLSDSSRYPTDYAQAARNDDGTYVVEHRDGGPDEHYVTIASDMRAAHSLLAGWAHDIPGWRESHVWKPVNL